MINEPVPNDGVSAYFDEELSASEHDVVAHHLSQSAAAKTELAEIRRLSEELRNLPPELAPHQVHTQVLNALAHRRTQAARAGADPFSRGIILASKWLGAAAAVALLASWIPAFWNPTQPTELPDTVAANSSPAMEPNDRPKTSASTILPEETAAKRPDRVMLGSEGELLAESRTQRSLAKPDASPGFGVGPAGSGFGGRDLPNAMMLSSGDVNNSVATQDKTKPTDPLLANILELANQQADRVVVVEVADADLEQTLKQLQMLLAKNAVVPANFQLNQPQAPLANAGRKQAEEDLHLSLFVQSSPEQVLSALAQLRARSPLTQIQPRTSLAMSSIPMRESSEIPSYSRGFASRFRESLADSVQKYEAGQSVRGLGEDSGGFGKTPIADQSQPEKLTPRPAPRQASPAPPGIAAPHVGNFKFQGDLTESPKPAAENRSFQMIVQSSMDRWASKELASKAYDAPAETKPAEEKAARGQAGAARLADPAELAKKQSPPVPIRVMFIFRQTAPAPAK